MLGGRGPRGGGGSTGRGGGVRVATIPTFVGFPTFPRCHLKSSDFSLNLRLFHFDASDNYFRNFIFRAHFP